jgi:hypothetical protein
MARTHDIKSFHQQITTAGMTKISQNSSVLHATNAICTFAAFSWHALCTSIGGIPHVPRNRLQRPALLQHPVWQPASPRMHSTAPPVTPTCGSSVTALGQQSQLDACRKSKDQPCIPQCVVHHQQAPAGTNTYGSAQKRMYMGSVADVVMPWHYCQHDFSARTPHCQLTCPAQKY